jgi:transformation/transcription domain-associated protein
MLTGTLNKLVTNQANIDNRRLAVDLCEMIIKWELYRLKECQDSDGQTTVSDPEIMAMLMSPQPSSTTTGSYVAPPAAAAPPSATGADGAQQRAQLLTPIGERIDKPTVDRVMDILIRMAATVRESQFLINSNSFSHPNNLYRVSRVRR